MGADRECRDRDSQSPRRHSRDRAFHASPGSTGTAHAPETERIWERCPWWDAPTRRLDGPPRRWSHRNDHNTRNGDSLAMQPLRFVEDTIIGCAIRCAFDWLRPYQRSIRVRSEVGINDGVETRLCERG